MVQLSWQVATWLTQTHLLGQDNQPHVLSHEYSWVIPVKDKSSAIPAIWRLWVRIKWPSLPPNHDRHSLPALRCSGYGLSPTSRREPRWSPWAGTCHWLSLHVLHVALNVFPVDRAPTGISIGTNVVFHLHRGWARNFPTPAGHAEAHERQA